MRNRSWHILECGEDRVLSFGAALLSPKSVSLRRYYSLFIP